MNFLKEMKKKLKGKSGINTIEIVLIVIVLVGLVLIFRTQITSLFTTIFTELNKSVKGLF